jgi:hypothetical protein
MGRLNGRIMMVTTGSFGDAEVAPELAGETGRDRSIQSGTAAGERHVDRDLPQACGGVRRGCLRREKNALRNDCRFFDRGSWSAFLEGACGTCVCDSNPAQADQASKLAGWE